jgi:hypothetical protein
MILEGLLFLCLGIVILIFFYKQANTEFQIAQVDSFDKIQKLIQERNPVVIQPFISPKQLWTLDDIHQRQSLGSVLIPNLNITLQQASYEKDKILQWDSHFAEKLADITGLPVWANQMLTDTFKTQSLLTKLYSYRTEVYLGPQGLCQTYGTSTFIFTTEGTATLTLLNEQSNPYLPKGWKGKLLSKLTRDEAPLIGQIQCIDIVLRPGSCLMIPPHWKYCIEEDKKDTQPVCSVKITVHHPISKLMERSSLKQN